MSTSPFTIEIDPKVINEIVTEKINQQLLLQVHWVDIDRLQQITSMSYRFLHENFLKRPCVKQFERTKSRKKYYKYPEVIHEINKIIEVEW